MKTLRSELLRYIIGFVLAAILTLGAYTVAIQTPVGNVQVVAMIILGLAAAQMLVQVVFFLHVGQEAKPRWQTHSFVFVVLMLLVIVVGSLWIMQNLDYNMMPPQDGAENYMLKQNSKGF